MEKLKQFRAAMNLLRLDAYVLATGDPHFSEYTADHWKSRQWLSGFTGSAGTLVVTADEAALWTDSRYFVQAERQLQGSGILLQKMGEENVPSLETWISERVPSGGLIALDGRLISHANFELMLRALPVRIFKIDQDLVGDLWKERPNIPLTPAWPMPVELSGMSIQEKRRPLNKLYQTVPYLITALDEIAWLCNLRGNDIAFNPVNTAFAIVEQDTIHLFMDKQKLSKATQAILASEQVNVLAYDSLLDFCKKYAGKKLLCNASKINEFTYSALMDMGVDCQFEPAGASPLSLLKACKTPAEIDGFRKAMQLDGVAWTKLLYWMEQELNAQRTLTELQIAEAFTQIRQTSSPDYLEESFAPIVAYGEHGAIVHYEPTASSDVPVGRASFLLMDTGAHYRFGTTDTTRTWHFGQPTAEEMRDYTLVLQGMIRLSMAQFPKGTRGAQLDMLARQPLMSQGMSFSHGTGHGVGHVLCVHEGPQSIRLQENPVQLQLGMIQSNEPAVYKTDHYGIRIENLLLVVPGQETEWGIFYTFETLTLVPICERAVDYSLLHTSEIRFLRDYQRNVYQQLRASLTSDEVEWLFTHTNTVR